MKIKILMVPLSIAVSIILLIWMVWPMFTNGFDGVLETSEKLKQKETKFAQLEDRISNAEMLFAQLSSDNQKDTLYQFIPDSAKEEEIIDNVNYIASSAGLKIFKIAIELPVIKKPLFDMDESLVQDGVEASDATQIIEPVQDVKMDLSFAGSYESMKKFMDELHRLGRSSDVEKLSIGQYGGEEETSEILMAEAEIEFQIMPAVKMTNANANDPVFQSKQINMDIVAKIKEAKNREVLELEAPLTGKINPFSL